MPGPQKKEKQKPVKFFGMGESLPHPLGFGLPDPAKLSLREQYIANEEHKKTPAWKRQTEGVVSGLLGDSLLGYDPTDPYNPLDPETAKGMALGELAPMSKVLGLGKVLGPALAMMPFPYGKRLAHATKYEGEFRNLVNQGIDMNRNQPADVLGWMTHLTTESNPMYSQSFGGPSLLATLKTNNYVDLNNLTPDDIARIYGQLSPTQKRYLKESVRENVKAQARFEPDPLLRRGKPGSENFDPKQAKLLSEGEARSFVEQIPQSRMENTGIEAFRYHDLGDATRPAIAVTKPDIVHGAYTSKPLGGKRRADTMEGRRVWEVSPSGEAQLSDIAPISEIKPDYPFIHNPKTKPFHDEFEGNILSPSSSQKVEDRFTNKGHAGGTHGARIVTSQKTGEDYVFKPQSIPFLNLSEYISTKLANLVNKVTPVAKLTQGGTVQRYAGDFPTIRELGTHEDFILQHPDLIPQIQREHVVDWLIGNHDAHGGNFLFDEANNRLIPMDKGQAFKYYDDDILSSNYHPNQKFGESEPIYNALLRLAREGKVKLDPQVYYDAAKEANKAITSIPKVMREYANMRFGPVAAERFLAKFEDRKKSLGSSFMTLLHDEGLPSSSASKKPVPSSPYNSPADWKSITDIPNLAKTDAAMKQAFEDNGINQVGDIYYASVNELKELGAKAGISWEAHSTPASMSDSLADYYNKLYGAAPKTKVPGKVEDVFAQYGVKSTSDITHLANPEIEDVAKDLGLPFEGDHDQMAKKLKDKFDAAHSQPVKSLPSTSEEINKIFDDFNISSEKDLELASGQTIENLAAAIGLPPKDTWGLMEKDLKAIFNKNQKTFSYLKEKPQGAKASPFINAGVSVSSDIFSLGAKKLLKLADDLGIDHQALAGQPISKLHDKLLDAYDSMGLDELKKVHANSGSQFNKELENRAFTPGKVKPTKVPSSEPPTKQMAEKGKGWGTLTNPFDSENQEKVLGLADKFGLNWNKYPNYYELGKAVLAMQKAKKHHVPNWLSKPYGFDTKPAKIIK